MVSNTPATTMERARPTGISVLVVGAGPAGLAFAIEGYRKGHNVRIIEKKPTIEDLGDIFGIQHSALRTAEKWPGFLDRLDAITCTRHMTAKKYDGTPIGTFPTGNEAHPAVTVFRPDFHNLLFEYLAELGVTVEFDRDVTEYREDGNRAYVVLADGEQISADVVVAADGLGSRSWALITGEKSEPFHSGFAVYRVSFAVEEALRSQAVAQEMKGREGFLGFFPGPDSHFVACLTKQRACWLLTHKDDGKGAESWRATGSSDDARAWVNGWAPFVTELINTTPEKRVIDWKLMWRDPQPVSVSPLGRVVQIGDAAHAFLPTSGSGATMAIEDAYSLATCLQLAGKDSIPLALRVHNKLRFERVACAQKLGLKTRDAYHHTNWDAIKKDPGPITEFIPNWLANHDPERYAKENFDACANHVTGGSPFKNTNFPKGYTYKPWKVKDLIEASDRGEPLEDEGDWS